MNECENCGESVDSRWKFCLNCGARMQVQPAAPTAPSPHTSIAQAAQVPQLQQTQLQSAQGYREVPSYLAERIDAPEPQYDRHSPYDQHEPHQHEQHHYEPQSDYDRAMDVDESSAGSHVGRRKFRFDWQLALGVVLALGGIAMIVYLVVVLIVPHN